MLSKNNKVAAASASRGPKGTGGRNGSQNPATAMSAEMGSEDTFNLKAEVNLLKADIERRQESYIARERAYKQRIDELEEEFNRQKGGKTAWMKTDAKMRSLKHMQEQIVDNVELVQDRTAHVLQEQERDLLRAFRARLFDVQTELEKEKGKKDDGAGAWIEKCRQLGAEVEWAKQVADRLERVNQELVSENSRLKSQSSSQEMDRNNLIKELCAYKKDNSILRAEYAALETENESLGNEVKKIKDELNSSSSATGNAAGAMSRTNAQTASSRSDNEERQREANKRLRRLLEEERKALKQVRQNYANELRHRTEMELLLRSCVEDVRNEISRRKIEDAHFSGTGKRSPARETRSSGETGGSISNDAFMKLYGRSNNGKSMSVENFTKAERERVLELLLSQERVVTLLYAKTFPIGGRNTQPNPLSPEHGNPNTASITPVAQIGNNDTPVAATNNISLPQLAPANES